MILIDTIYQRVLALANKEQRGYITPQEFNLFANQAQMEIFDQYFYDINQLNRIAMRNNTENSDPIEILREKISIFSQSDILTVIAGVANLPGDLYKISSITHAFQGRQYEVEEVTNKELNYMLSTPLINPTQKRPVYVASGVSVNIQPALAGNITCDYIRKPVSVNWAYNVINGTALYNNTNAVNFELHTSEEAALVYKILKLAGVPLEEPGLTQVGEALETRTQQLKKQ